MKKFIFSAALSIAALSPTVTQAANPFLPLWEFIPDGEPYVFEDPDNPGQYRVYLYGSHDMLIEEYCGRDQVVWSAPIENLRDWRCDGKIFESIVTANGDTLNWDKKADVLYAPDIALVTDADGKKTYYLYPNDQNGGRQTLIAKSDRPDGPFTVCNWDPKKPWATIGELRFDPAVLVDDDGRVYGYWGFERSYAAELDPATMCTVKPGTKVVEDMISHRNQEGEFRFFEASSIRKIKDKYVFIYSRWTAEGEFGMPSTNYTLAYAYSNSPLGPWTYGGTIIDGRGRETKPNGQTIATATPTGNTHGSICEINGQWWVFYHRQTGVNEFSRQAMVAPIDVEVTEGPEGTVRISEAEYTSEGFEIEGLDPFESHIAGIACYYVGPRPAIQQYPKMFYPGSHVVPVRNQYNGGETPVYDPSVNKCNVVNNVAGSVVGYKYFNCNKTHGLKNLLLRLSYIPQGVKGTIEIWAKHPNEEEGGVKVGTLEVLEHLQRQERNDIIKVDALSELEGKQAIYFVFKSDAQDMSLCTLTSFVFEVAEMDDSSRAGIAIGLSALPLILLGLFWFAHSRMKKSKKLR